MRSKIKQGKMILDLLSLSAGLVYCTRSSNCGESLTGRLTALETG